MVKYIYKLKWIIFVKIITAVISIIGLAAMPYITKLLFDYDFSKGASGVIYYIALYFVAILIGMSFEGISQLHAWKLNKEFNLLVKEDVFSSIVNLPFSEFKRRNTGEYTSIFNNDIAVAEGYVESVVAIIQTSIQVIIYAIYIFYLDYRIAIVIMIGSIISLFLPTVTSKALSDRRGAHLNAMGLYTNKIQDLLEGFKNINNQTRKQVIANQSKSLNDMENKLLYFGRFSTFANLFSGSFMYLLNIACFATVGILLLQSSISIGTGIATLGYVESFVFPLSYILKETSNIKSTKSTKDKLIGFLEYSKNTRQETQKISQCNTDITFKNVTVCFDGFSLEDFSYTFKKGKKYAIVGHNGSGKSTILNAFLHYVDLEKGEISVDGVSICNCNYNDFTGFTNPSSHTYHSSFTDNVTIFGSYPSEKMESVIKDLDNMRVNSIKNTEDCTALSNGEKQLMEFIKMILSDKDIMLFDEPFSALDIKNSKKLQDKLKNIENKIIIVITHDLSKDNLKDFDEVILMKNGKIVKSGKPDVVFQDYKSFDFKNDSTLTDNCD